MNKPTLRKYKKPSHISQYPLGPCFEAGHLVTINAGWRNEKPVIDHEKCINCLQCYMHCPDGVILKTKKNIDIDYNFCKGCGICSNICPKDAIKMEREA
jgi:pyruvate ferredoxin oxidoreductase delta subunit